MNPFEHLQVNYSDFVHEQLSGMPVGSSIKVDIGKKCIADFRMTMRYVADKRMCGARFKTKLSEDGNLWVMRVG